MLIKKLWRWLIDFLPVSVYQVWGPPGLDCGPWFERVDDAAEFIENESALDSETLTPVKAVVFPLGELAWLRGGWTNVAEHDEWTIKRVWVPRRRLDEEWSGW